MPSSEAKSLLNSLGRAALPIASIIEDLEDSPLPADLPKAFPGVAKWLPSLSKACTTLKDAIRAKKSEEESPEDKETYRSQSKLVDECVPLANQLQTYFSSVTADEDKNLAARLERYKGRVQEEAEGRRAETIMQEILERFLQVVVTISVGESEELRRLLQDAVKEVKGLPASLETTARPPKGSYHFHNSGSGVQPIHLGERGVQQIKAGSGPQINGNSSNAQFNFGVERSA